MKEKLFKDIDQYLLNINEYAVHHISDWKTTLAICRELRKIKNRVDKIKSI